MVRAGEERLGHSPGVSEHLTPVARALPIHFHFSLSLRKTEFRGGTKVVTSLVDHTGNEGRVPCSSCVQNPSSRLDREGGGPLAPSLVADGSNTFCEYVRCHLRKSWVICAVLTSPGRNSREAPKAAAEQLSPRGAPAGEAVRETQESCDPADITF